jgi:hypothetical protein
MFSTRGSLSNVKADSIYCSGEVNRMNRVWYENPRIFLLVVLAVLSPGIAKIITAIVQAIF